jgi:hypothetical protein
MSATVLGFFTPTDVLGLGGSFIAQSDAPVTTKKRAQGLLANGDEGISKTYGEETKRTVTYEHQNATGVITLPPVGSVMASLHIDSIDVEYQPNAWPKVSFQTHQHAVNPHTAANEYSSTIALPSQFGIPRALDDGAEPTAADIFKLGADDTGIGIKSMKYSLSCTHQDEDGETGDHLAGENRDGVEKLDIGLTGIPASVTVGADWDNLSDGTSLGNTAADARNISLEHHIARDVAE